MDLVWLCQCVNLVLPLTVVALVIILMKSRRRTPLNLPPGPRGWQALRCLLAALRQSDLHTQAETWSRRYGELVLCRSVLKDMCFLNSARLVRKVYAGKEHEALTNNRPSTFSGWYVLYGYRDVALGSPHLRPEWPKLRKLLHHAIKFYGDGVERVESTVHIELQRLVTELESSSPQDTDIGVTLSNSLFCMLAVLLTGECPTPDSRLVQTMRKLDTVANELLNPVTDTILTVCPWLRFVPLLPFRSLCADVIRARDDLHLQIFTGAKLFANTGMFHRDPEVFPDPERFRPDRFLDDTGHVVPATHPLRQSLVPFGIGKRSCLGESFARSRVFLYVTTLLQKFDILPPVNHELLPATGASWNNNGIVHELKPYHVVFHRRS